MGIAGAITVKGSGEDTLNLDDSGDTTAWTGNQEPTLTATNLTGLGMGTATGVGYSDLAALNLYLGTKPQTVDVKSTAAGTTSTIITQAAGNTWNVGSLAPTITGGSPGRNPGPAGHRRRRANTALTDTLNVDDSGSTRQRIRHAHRLDPDGLGMGAGGVTFDGMAVLNINLGITAPALDGNITDNLPATTVITGGPSRTDTFISTGITDFNGSLTLIVRPPGSPRRRDLPVRDRRILRSL